MPPSSPATDPGSPREAPLLQPYGSYLLVRKLTEGGMAEIFLAKQLGAEGFERNVVIKRLLPQLSNIPEFVQMFLDEARLAARLSHPNVVQIHDLGKADDCYFIAMEYLAGEDFSTTLRTLARAGRYTPLQVVVQVLISAARGLHHAHEFQDENGAPLGVVHRDISPSNLHLTYQGQVKVLDFGIAWAQTRLTKTQAGVVKGKYSYMAPEQARGEQVDRRADVYSLGVSLYEGLTNIRPLVRENDLAMLNAVLTGEYSPPRQHRPDLPEALEACVLCAMALDPAERFQTAGEFADTLEEILPSLGGPPALGTFLRESFGEEHFLERTRIPSLETLRAGHAESSTSPRPPPAPDEIPTATTPISRNPLAAAVPARPSPEDGRPLVLSAPPDPDARGPSRRRRWLALGAGALVLAVVLAAALLLPARPPAVEPGPLPDLSHAAAVTPVDPEPRPVPVPTDPAAHAGIAPEPEPQAVEPAAEIPVATRTPSPPRPPRTAPALATLSVGDVERVVSRGQARYAACFEEHKGELPSESGELQIRVSIAASGRAKAGVEGALELSNVGRCVARAVGRLRFPEHRDQEIQVLFPLNWRVTR